MFNEMFEYSNKIETYWNGLKSEFQKDKKKQVKRVS